MKKVEIEADDALERKKLQLEIRDLSRPYFLRPEFIAAITPMIVAGITLLGVWWAGYFDERKSTLEIAVQKLEARRDELERFVADSVLAYKEAAKLVLLMAVDNSMQLTPIPNSHADVCGMNKQSWAEASPRSATSFLSSLFAKITFSESKIFPRNIESRLSATVKAVSEMLSNGRFAELNLFFKDHVPEYKLDERTLQSPAFLSLQMRDVICSGADVQNGTSDDETKARNEFNQMKFVREEMRFFYVALFRALGEQMNKITVEEIMGTATTNPSKSQVN